MHGLYASNIRSTISLFNVYSHVPHNDVLVNDGLRIRRWLRIFGNSR